MLSLKNSILLFFILTLSFKSQCQQLIDSIYNNKIHTVQLYKEGFELNYPIIRINSDEKLKLTFDDFNPNIENYIYTIIHCNSSWESSNLAFTEYANGFEENQITDNDYSINTIIKYIHYSLVFPNQNCEPLISGNYIIKVYKDYDTSKVAFTRRFYISETTAVVDLKVMRPEVPKYMLKYQQFKLNVIPNVNASYDLKNEIKAIVTQNNMPARTKTNLVSRLEHGNTLVYDDLDENIFEAGNEFRNFDAKSIKYKSPKIKKMEYAGPFYTIELYPDEWRNKTKYFYEQDLNGKYYIENSRGTEKETDADYVMIFFSLPSKEVFIDGDMYVYGALNYWNCNQSSKMTYNFETKAYEARILLKQGYYNYQYAYVPHETHEIDLSFAEGNNWETENDYLAFIYYKPFGARYERLIGYRIANSLNK